MSDYGHAHRMLKHAQEVEGTLTGVQPKVVSSIPEEMQELPAMSWHQPWAWAIIHGYKDVSNRHKHTTYRGIIFVHASKTKPQPGGIEWLTKQGIALPAKLELGYVVGWVTLSDSVMGSDRLLAVPGKCHWLLDDPVLLETPVQATGQTRMFYPFSKQPQKRKYIPRAERREASVWEPPKEKPKKEEPTLSNLLKKLGDDV